jgi:hypothetical protein
LAFDEIITNMKNLTRKTKLTQAFKMGEEDMDEEPYKTTDFMAYHANHLAIHKDKPWQLVTRSMCILIGYKATREEAQQALDALQKDKDAGILPNNLSKWDKHDQFLSDKTPDLDYYESQDEGK